MKSFIKVVAVSLLFSSQAMAMCSQSPQDGYWSNNSSSLNILTECKQSDMGPDYMTYSVWNSVYGTSTQVSRRDGYLSIHFGNALQHIHLNSDPLMVDTYKSASEGWERTFYERAIIDSGGLIPTP